DRAQQAAPWLAGPRRLLQTCLDAYPALLRGELDPVAVLFPQASMDLVVAAYDGNPIADHFNTEIAAAVRSAVAEAAPGQGLRILELGAGTGSTTAAVLNALVPFRDRVTYVATDVSQRFLAHGQARFATHPNIRFALHDIERDAAANGQEEGSFDLILAANVLHATADLTATLSRTRRLLKPGGRLLLSEATRAQDFGTMVFGLTPGWWRAEDRARRIPFSPLATVASWQALMREAGFATAETITVGAAATTPHALLVAENREVFVPRIEPAVQAVAQPAVLPRPTTVVAAAGGGSLTRLHDHLRTILADVLKLDAHEVRLNESFDRYGLESLTALEVRNRLDRDIPGLPATLLFEHNTLALLASWLAASHTEAVARLFPDAPSPPMSAGGVTPAPAVGPSTADSLPPSPPSAAAAERPPAPRPAFCHDEPIAIIGFHGRYPGGADADAFWRLLHAGETAITDVPAERWPAGSLAPGFFDPAGGEGTSYTKWAGFIPDVDRFDPLFFAISPLDAEVMDPQERLFLETAWATLEQAGYTPRRLRDVSATDHGGDVGVFVGAMNVPYQWVAAEAWGAGHASAASTNYWSIANRVSFLFDFAGPSMVVDTACSASMTAIHLACESLRRGECGAALAGGVNLILHPRQFINLSQARMVSRGGECRAFGADADGFVDGEGVGAVLLKPLSSALRDGDRIEGVILGTAVNAGGRTSGFTVPNPKAQARVIRAALHRAGVEPGSVSYVEAHGTGTALGDPIEIAGLVEVFAEPNRAPCAIGAVKANIGHLESAAGIAGLTKVLLQFRHRTIAPLRHAATPNPLIDLAATPFVLPDAPMAWNPTQPGGRLRAGISSFGAGGANAHLVIEDFPEAPPRSSAADRPDLVVLSARDADRLRAVAEALLAAIRARPVPLQDLAHTLRVGREAMAARLAIHAATLPDLEQKLATWLADHPPAGVLAGSAATGTSRLLAETPEGEALLQGLLARRDFDRLARLWVEGADIDWTRLPVDPAARLVVLPTYPFRRERYWLPVPDAGAGSIEPAVPTTASTDAAPQPAAVDVPVDTPAPTQEPPLESAADSAPEFAQETIGQAVRLQLFARAWQPAAASPHRVPGPVALVSDDDALAESFASLWPSALIRVRTGPAFAIDGPCLRFNPAQEADHAALIAHLARLHPDGFAIVQALDWRGTGAAHDPGVGVRPSILLTQAAQRHGAVPMRIIHLYADAAARPLDEGVAALARSAMQESMACRLRAVGLGGPADVHRAALACRDELISADDAPDIRHGANGRLAPTIEPVAIDPQAATIGFRIGGAYLLVGGLGEVGCAIAERLGRDYRARIAIIGRSKPRGVALARLNQLRDAGILVHYQACDLNDRAGLERALTAIRGQLGRLHGVLHLARTVEDALLVRKSPDSMARVMAAKVEGTITLDEALAQEELDWFVLCSSLAAWLGLAGGGDYALACAFQNGFARLRQQRVERGERFGRTVAICWPQWRHDRYLNDAKLRRLAAEGLQTIDARDGLRIIAQALQSDRTEVAAIKGAERALHRLTLAYRADTAPMVASPVAMAPPSVAVDDIAADLHGLSDAELDAYLAYLRQEVADDVAEPVRLPIVAAPPPPEPRLAAPKPEPVVAEPGVREASAEAAVLETICSFLKLPRDRFTAESEFAAFGLDSIKALHVAERLQKLLGVPVDPAMFYEHPRIGAFAQAVAARCNPHAARATP
ncbi:MAG: L-histidine N(alpha)-methyltransferase, partial [Acetobacteraceae bacterium]